MDQRKYKAIFFDLDGTLLPMDMTTFLRAYFVKLGEFSHKQGLGVVKFGDAMRKSVTAIATDKTGRLNSEVFWSTFYQLYGYTDRDIEAAVDRFYETDFGSLGDRVDPNPAARYVVEALRIKGYPLYLVTMPLFPQRAIEQRLEWAGIHPDDFKRISTYDNSFASKPDLAFYRQNIEIAGCDASEVLMVGNNTKDDLAILELGADAFLVTDFLLDPDHYDIDSVKHGTMEEFADFVDEMPEFS